MRASAALRSLLMTEAGDGDRDLALLVVPQSGALVETGLPFEPYQLVDPGGAVISPATAYLRELQGRGRAESTQRSYSLALLRWFRFLWAAGVPWDQATRAEARDFMRWLQVTCAAGSRPARCEGQGKAQGFPLRLGITGEGKAGHGVNNSEALLMPRNCDSPGRVVMPGRQGHAVATRQAAVKDIA